MVNPISQRVQISGVLRSGRTLSVAAADVFSVKNGKQTLCATAPTTLRNFESSASNRQ
jgi:hypothetical protein